MKAIQFEHNATGMRYEYHRTREGPNWFMCYYKGSAVTRTDPKEAWRTLGVAKFTDSGKALKEWAMSMHEEYGTKIDEQVGREDTSFASEVQAETEAPNDNTRMVT